jgi:hypothetical protein
MSCVTSASLHAPAYRSRGGTSGSWTQQTPQNIDWLKSNGYIDTDGKTIKKRVPEREFRWVLQNETKGQNQQRASHVQYDWLRIWTPKL